MEADTIGSLDQRRYRIQENPLYGRFDEMLHGFLLKPEQKSPPSATLRVADLYSGTSEISTAAREVGLDVTYEHDPDDHRNPDFDLVPAFDILTATLPSRQRADALDRILRFLRVRRPWAFLLVDTKDDNQFLLKLQDKTDRLGYRINRTSESGLLSFVVGTLGQDLPGDVRGTLIGRLIEACVEIRQERR